MPSEATRGLKTSPFLRIGKASLGILSWSTARTVVSVNFSGAKTLEELTSTLFSPSEWRMTSASEVTSEHTQ